MLKLQEFNQEQYWIGFYSIQQLDMFGYVGFAKFQFSANLSLFRILQMTAPDATNLDCNEFLGFWGSDFRKIYQIDFLFVLYSFCSLMNML